MPSTLSGTSLLDAEAVCCMLALERKELVASKPDESIPEPGERAFPEPSEAEIEEWATHERQRREAWLKGPTEEQKAAWARRERERRLAELEGRLQARRFVAEQSRLFQRTVREAQLAAEGAMSLLFKVSLSDAFEQLVRAGRDWEEEFTSAPTRRRRVALDADASEREASGATRRPLP
jgi:hypothetical protein